MALVPIYNRTEKLAPDHQGNFTVRANAEQMGAAVGRGMRQFGAGIGQAGDHLQALQELEANADGKDRANKFHRAALELQYGEGGYMHSAGQNAVADWDGYKEGLEGLRAQFAEGASPQALKHYNNSVESSITSKLRSGVIHRSQQQKGHILATNAQSIKDIGENIVLSHNDPDAQAAFWADAEDEIRKNASIQGLSEDLIQGQLSEFKSTAHRNTVAMIGSKDPLAANAYFEKHKSEIGFKDQLAIQQKLEAPVMAARVSGHVAKFNGSGAAPDGAASLIKKMEGFRTTPYWDVNALRTGYGSDTVTYADGSVVRVTKGMKITRADAERDLDRRINKEFIPKIKEQISDGIWNALPKPAQAALASVAYNYGSLPKSVVKAAKLGAIEDIAKAVEGLQHHNKGINRKRRLHEAAIIRGMTGVSIQSAVAAPTFGDVEGYLAGIKDPEERALTRKAIYARMDADAKMQKRQRQDSTMKAYDLVNDQNLSPFDFPNEMKSAVGREGMIQLMDYWNKMQAGETIVSDPELLYKLRREAAKDPAGFSNKNLTTDFGKLSKADQKELTGLQTKILSGDQEAKATGKVYKSAYSQADTALAALGISTTGLTGEKNRDARQAQAKRIAEFNNALKGQIDQHIRQSDGAVPDYNTIEKMINQLLLPIAIEDKSEIFGDGFLDGWSPEDGKRLFDARLRPEGAGAPDIIVQYEDIPADVKRAISLKLERENKQKPTEDEIVDYYETVYFSRSYNANRP